MNLGSIFGGLLRKSVNGNIVKEPNSTRHMTDWEKCEFVRQNLLVRFCTNFVSRQLARIEYTVKPKGLPDWQYRFFDKFVKKEFKELIVRIYPQAWSYNFAYADTCFEGDPAVPDHFVVLHSHHVSDLMNDVVWYRGFKIPRNYLFYLELRDRRDRPHALDMYDHVDWLSRVYQSEANGSTIHSQGIHWLEWLGGIGNPPTDKDKKYAQSWLDSIGTSQMITGSHSKYKPLAINSPGIVTAEAPIQHNRNAVLTDFDLQWIDASTWTSGTFASMRMQLRGFLDMVDSEADTITRALKLYAKQIAEINDCELSVDFEHSVPRIDESPKETLEALQMVKGMTLRQAEAEMVYSSLGLPVPDDENERLEETNVEVPDEPQLSKAEKDLGFRSGTNYLNNKMEECLNGFVITVDKKRNKVPNITPYKIGKVAESASTLGLSETTVGNIFNEYSVVYRNLIDRFVLQGGDSTMIRFAFKGVWRDMCEKIEEVRRINASENKGI